MTVYTNNGSIQLANNVRRVTYYVVGGGGGGAVQYVRKDDKSPWVVYSGDPPGGRLNSTSGQSSRIRVNGSTFLTAGGGGGGGVSSGGSGGSGNFSGGASGARGVTCGSPRATPGSTDGRLNSYGTGGAGATPCSSCSNLPCPSTFGGGGGGASKAVVNRGSFGANPGDSISWEIGAGGLQGGFGDNRNGGEGAVAIEIEVYQNPSGSITANNSGSNITVTSGTQVTLRWSTNNAETVSILNTSISNSTQVTGQTTITPTQTRTYELRAGNLAFPNNLVDSITVTVIDPPVFFLNASATERVNIFGDSVNLNWGITSGTANRVVWTSTFNGDIPSPSPVTSNATVRPGVTTTYTAFAEDTTNGARSPSISRTITVYQPASATITGPSTVNYGQQITLTCTVANATLGASLSVSYTYQNNQTITGQTINLSNGTNNITSSIPYTNFGPLEINYTLLVRGGSSTRPSNATATKTVTVIIPPPNITLFTASPVNILSGNSSTLSWNVTGVAFDTISISSLGSSLPKQNSQPVSPSSTRVYTLTATNVAGTRTATATVNVFQRPDVTLSLVKNPIVRGETTTLSWSTAGNATTAFLTPIVGNTNIASDTPVNPVNDTTYTISVRLLVPPDIDVTDTDEKTLVVLQPPTASLEGPNKIKYGEQGILSFSATNAVTSVTLRPIYTYRNETVQGSPVTLPTGLDISDDYVTGIPYTEWGPFQVQYVLDVVGFGDPGSELTISKQIVIPIEIDETPTNFIIPESLDKIKNEEPVVTPDSAVTSFRIEVDDIDIPVEIKSNRPIEVRFDDDDTWNKVRQI